MPHTARGPPHPTRRGGGAARLCLRPWARRRDRGHIGEREGGRARTLRWIPCTQWPSGWRERLRAVSRWPPSATALPTLHHGASPLLPVPACRRETPARSPAPRAVAARAQAGLAPATSPTPGARGRPEKTCLPRKCERPRRRCRLRPHRRCLRPPSADWGTPAARRVRVAYSPLRSRPPAPVKRRPPAGLPGERARGLALWRMSGKCR